MKNKSEVDKCLKNKPPQKKTPKTVPSNTHIHRDTCTLSSAFKSITGAFLQ